MISLPDAAHGIASDLGWSVFPLQPGTKRPATARGLHAATRDPELIERWWQRCSRFNIGVSCGPSGLLVVDLDVKAVDGVSNWFALASRLSSWIDTLVVATPSGGEHWYLAIEPGRAIGNSAGKLAEGIDVRCEGGYVVAPPSVLDGNEYEVLSDHHPVPAPDWLIALLVEPVTPRLPATPQRLARGYGQAALDGELGRLALAPEGQRNHSLVRASFRIGQLVGSGQLDATDVTSQLLAVALRIGLGTREAESTIRSGLEAGLAKPRTAA